MSDPQFVFAINLHRDRIGVKDYFPRIFDRNFGALVAAGVSGKKNAYPLARLHIFTAAIYSPQMTEPHFAAVFAAAILVGMSKGGLTSAAALAVPMLALWYDPLVAAAFLLPVYIVSDVAAVWLYRRDFSVSNVKLLIICGLAGVTLATLLAPYIPVAALTLATGLIGLAYCLRVWLLRSSKEARRAPLPAGIFWGVLTGITSFVSHSGGPPFQTYVLPQRLPKLVYAGTTTMVFAAINLAKVPAYWSLGLMDNLRPTLLIVLCTAAIAGAFAGRKVAEWLPEQIYVRLIEVLLFILSLRLIWQGLAAWL